MMIARLPIFLLAIILITILIVKFILVKIHTKKARRAFDRLLMQAKTLVEVKGILIFYEVANGPKRFFPHVTLADIYLFEDFMVISMTSNTFLFLPYALQIVSKEPDKIRFGEIPVLRLEKAELKKNRKNTLVIYLADRRYNHYKTIITLKQLTDEQINKLLTIRLWNG